DDPDAITLGAAYDTMPSISIDYGVMEGAKDISVVPVDCGWSDVGSWAALGAMAHADNAGNVVWGDALSIDSHDNVFFAPKGHLVAAIGVEGLAVVHTADATLVLPVQDAQRVREVVTLLQEKGLEAFL
ncbi:mannose-1-phosphate guanylyltransferase/mannose-6-phosphate isomerase, partial [Myxococcota bacterium]|nr:mannose-1-phosphate guanylyltransferase/mannose-6-phosphate isomerase [Myxococcota bacterium]